MARKEDVQTQYDSKAEKARAEREARLEAQKNRDGSHKPHKGKSKLGKKILTVILALLVIAAIVITILWQTGVIQRNLNAITVGENNVSINEYNYNYNTLVGTYTRYFGKGGLLDKKADSSAATKEDITWGEFFEKTTNKNLQQVNLLYQEAVKSGFELSEENVKEIDNYIESMKQQTGSPLNFEIYLHNLYGKGMNVESLRELMLKNKLATEFASNKPSTYEISQDEIDKEYNENVDKYDLVTFNSFQIVTETKDSDDKALTSEELKKAKEKSEAKTKEAVEKISKGEEFKKVAIEMATDEKSKEKLQESEEDLTLQENINLSNLSNKDILDWLTSKDRKDGDVKYFEIGDNYQILKFSERKTDTRNIADVRISRFSLYDSKGNEISDEQKKAVKNNAVGMTKAINSEADFEKFDKEAKDNNDSDKIIQSESVKYENVDAMNEAKLQKKVLDFVLSPEAQTGKTELIETDAFIYVVHIVDKKDVTSRDHQIVSALQMKKSEEDLKKLTEAQENQVKPVYPGYWFAKR